MCQLAKVHLCLMVESRELSFQFWPSIVKHSRVFDVQVRTPVADFGRPLKTNEFYDGVFIVVLHSDGPLVLCDEIGVR